MAVGVLWTGLSEAHRGAAFLWSLSRCAGHTERIIKNWTARFHIKSDFVAVMSPNVITYVIDQIND